MNNLNIKYHILYIFILLLFINFNFILAQDKKTSLQNDKRKIEKEIELTNEMLQETRQNKKVSLHQLNILNTQIKKREELINVLRGEITEIDNEINAYNKQIAKHEQNIIYLQQGLAKLIYNAYKTRKSHDRLMYIFSAKDFNQALLRIKYLKLYGQYIKSNAEQIKVTRDNLNKTVENLKIAKEEKIQIIALQEREKEKLARDTKEKNEIVNKLKKKENQLRQTIKKKEKEAKELQDAINKLIQQEIAMSAKKTGIKPVKNSVILAPEEVALSDDFNSNKGKLPWPIEQGFISGTFGSHPHPVLPGIVIKNNGLNFTSVKGGMARAVFNGKVTAVTSIPGYNNVVMIRHGDYLSVYANLETVLVKTGDKVKTKQDIGTIYYDKDENNYVLHFELRKGTGILNPADWLLK